MPSDNSVIESTFYDKRWSSNKLMRSYEIEYEDGSVEHRIDYADPRLYRLLNSIKSFRTVTYNGVEKFTTFTWRYYGTTTLYRVILIFNGFFHPYELVGGQTIRLPYADELNKKLNDLSKPKRVSNVAII